MDAWEIDRRYTALVAERVAAGATPDAAAPAAKAALLAELGAGGRQIPAHALKIGTE